MKKLSVLIIIILSLCSSINLHSKEKENLDSLWNEYNNAKHDTTRIILLNEHIGYMYESINIDSAIMYYQQAIDIADSNIRKEKPNEINQRLFALKATSLRYIGIVQVNRGNYEQALKLYKAALLIAKEIGNKRIICQCNKNIGVIYNEQSDYNSANDFYLQALKLAQELNDYKELSQCYFNLGINYYDYGDYHKAIDSFQSSLIIREELGNIDEILKALIRISLVYEKLGNKDQALNYYEKAMKIAQEKENNLWLNYIYRTIGGFYHNFDDFLPAIEYYKLALQLAIELNDSNSLKEIYENIGNAYNSVGNWQKALENYFNLLNICELEKDKQAISRYLIDIAHIYRLQGDYSISLDYLLKSLEIANEISDIYLKASGYLSIGNYYASIKNYDKAISYYLKSIEIENSKESIDKSTLSVLFNNIGNAFMNLTDYDEAIKFYEQSLKIAEDISSKQELILVLTSLAELYGLKADTYNLLDEDRITCLKTSLIYGTRAYELANEAKILFMQNEASKVLMQNHRELGNHRKALEFADIFIATKDSLFNEEKTKAILEMEAKYQAEKKQLQIEKMEKQKLLDDKTIEVQHAQNRKQLVIIFSAFIGFIIVLVFSVIVMRMLQQKRRANRLLAQQNEEINQQKEEITAQRDEIEAQRNLVVEQKEHLEEVHKEIKDSINYAKRIQTSAMPDLTRVKNHFNDFFMLFKPKDVVSGDFYWFAEVENQLVITVADCTGHGVPGAFMSILGMSILKEIVVKEYITQPDVILRKLRKEVVRALSQKGEPGEQKDGMDMSLCSINTVTKYLQWSGANNPLILIRKGELSEIKPDKMPIAIYEKMDRFTLHEFQLKQGDQVYLIGDGYPDQFGGPKGKKIMSKNLKELLLEISNEPMNLQKKILEDKLYDWMNNYGVKYEQIDDITIMGIKI